MIKLIARLFSRRRPMAVPLDRTPRKVHCDPRLRTHLVREPLAVVMEREAMERASEIRRTVVECQRLAVCE